jgi:hypothetical protein
MKKNGSTITTEEKKMAAFKQITVVHADGTEETFNVREDDLSGLHLIEEVQLRALEKIGRDTARSVRKTGECMRNQGAKA